MVFHVPLTREKCRYLSRASHTFTTKCLQHFQRAVSSGGSTPSALKGAEGGGMNVDFCEDNSGSAEKIHYFQTNRGGGGGGGGGGGVLAPPLVPPLVS